MFELFSSCYWFKFQVFVIFFSSYWFLFVASVVSALSVLKFCSSCHGKFLCFTEFHLTRRVGRNVTLAIVTVCVSESQSVCESVCHRHDGMSRPRRPLAPVCPRPARPFSLLKYFFLSPLNSVQIRFPEMIWVVFLSARRFGLKRFDSVTFWVVFFICSALWPKAFRFCNFLFLYLHLRF